MVCQRCKKNRASVHITQVDDKDSPELHLCDECAQKEGATLKSQVSLADFLAGLVKTPVTKEMSRLAKLKCPNCGISYLDFQSKGRLGCPEDYEVFEDLVEGLLEKIHGATRHVGKTPSGSPTTTNASVILSSLKKKLTQAIDEERYEDAGGLRDEIRQLEDQSRAT